MSAENPTFNQPKPEPFGFTEHERLWDRVTDARFQAILHEEVTRIHEIEVASNSFGEFLFVSASRPTDTHRVHITFYGLGFHDGRDRWIKDEWFWYESTVRQEELSEQNIPLAEADALLQDRRTFVVGEAQGHTQSQRGHFFDMIADHTDDDGAMAEMDDLDGLFDDDL